MTTLKGAAPWLLVVALSVQLWYEARTLGRAPITFLYVFRIGLMLGCIALLATRGRVRRVERLVCVWIAVDFAYSIADRFGFAGPYGSPGVSWGNWKNFVIYTHTLNGFLPGALAPALAIAATIYEGFLVLTLPIDRYRGVATLAASLLTAIYVVTMTFTSGFRSQYDYAVVLICVTCLYIALRSLGENADERASVDSRKVGGDRAT